MRFPRETLRAVNKIYGDVGFEMTVQGNLVMINDRGELMLYGDIPMLNVMTGQMGYPSLKLTGEQARYVFVNAGPAWPIWGIKEPPAGTELFRTSHPLKFTPYQYEAYKPSERAFLRSADLSVRLIDRWGR